MAVFNTWYALIFPAIVLLHLQVAPYTKVEESFNIQAIHDILHYGVPVSDAALKFKTYFDHMTFPGSVPRTFIGSLLVTFFAQPIGLWRGLSGVELQVLVRAVLGVMNAAALFIYARAVRSRYGERTAIWFTAFQASQFHIIYYASRTLPNMFAFCLSTLALAADLTDPTSILAARRHKLSLYLLTLGAVVFRSELLLLLGALCLKLFFKAQGFSGRAALIRTTVAPTVIVAAAVGILLTVTIDTYFWQSEDYLWPEASAFLFNIFPQEGHAGASAWGTSPWYWYFTAAIPRLSSPALVLLPYGIIATPQRQAIMDQLLPSLVYTVLYSFVPHKETRFLFPMVPSLTLAMAITVSYISIRRHLFAKCVTALLVMSTIMISTLSHAVLLPLSAQSYPGAEAMNLLHQSHYSSGSDRPQIHVYLTNLALQTGVTRFLEQPAYPNTNSTFGSDVHATLAPQPMVMPGSPDGKFPALTYYPQSTGVPEARRLLPFERPLWMYEKIAPEDGMHPAGFWEKFDYVIVEDPSRVVGSWKLIGVATSLSRQRPRLTKRAPGENRLLVLGGEDTAGYINAAMDERNEDGDGYGKGLYELFFRMYGRNVAWLYGAVHDVLAGGYGVGGRGLTGGRWIHWGLEPRLYVLAQSIDAGVLETDGDVELSQSSY